jgi:PilZ domain
VQQRKGLGERKYERINYQRPGFIVPAPDAPWLECFIVDVSNAGICLDVGALVVPDIFAVAFNKSGTVMRVCQTVWRQGAQIGAEFLTAKQLRQGRQEARDPQIQEQPA